MKEIGDRVRSCAKKVCRVNNLEKIKNKILEEENVVGLIVSKSIYVNLDQLQIDMTIDCYS